MCGGWPCVFVFPMKLSVPEKCKTAGTSTASKHITFFQSPWKHWTSALHPTLRHHCTISSFWTPTSLGYATPSPSSYHSSCQRLVGSPRAAVIAQPTWVSGNNPETATTQSLSGNFIISCPVLENDLTSKSQWLHLSRETEGSGTNLVRTSLFIFPFFSKTMYPAKQGCWK